MNRDYERQKAKIKRKIRWYYTIWLQEPKRHLWLYCSYRHYRFNQNKGCKGAPKHYLTKEVHPGAGIGDQLASLITGMYYAKQFGIPYAYSKVYPHKWNDFLGFYKGSKDVETLVRVEKYKKVWLPCFEEKLPEDEQKIRDIISSYGGKKVIFLLELQQIYTEQYGIKNELQQKFIAARTPKKEALIYVKEKVNIAVHIRRGDIATGREYGDVSLTMRWMDNGYYVKILKNLLELMNIDNKKKDIYIFSQGKQEEFIEFNEFDNVHFCLDMSAMNSFLHMAFADVLISSKSSFSYVPALLSQGICICPKNFWHGYPKEERWLLVDDSGNVQEDKLKELVKKYLH